MAWIEARRNGWIVRWYVDGKKQSDYFDDRLDAEQFRADLVYGKRIGLNEHPTMDETLDALAEKIGRSRSRSQGTKSPRFASYARQLIESDDALGVGSKEGYDAVIRNHLEGTTFGLKATREVGLTVLA